MHPRDPNLLYAHSAASTLAQACAGGFLGAFLLQQGFGVPSTLAIGGASFAVRFFMRALALPAVRRMGYRHAFIVGTAACALGYPLLPWVSHPLVLAAWLAVSTAGEAVYWPVLHAAMACAGTAERRGRQMGLLSAVIALASVGGPLAGGLILEHAGPASDFALATVLTLLSAVPLLWLAELPAGPVPTLRQSWMDLDGLAVLAFAADGWMFGTINYGWSLVLFLALGSDYGSFGLATAAAGLLGGAVGLVCGQGMDRGRQHHFLLVALVTMGAVLAWRSSASWFPATATEANLAGSVVTWFYTPVLMGMLYDRAKHSGQAYRFHFSTEGGFDVGGCMGCLAAACMAAAFPSHLSLVCLPAGAGLLTGLWCIRRGTSQATTSVSA